jgi:eukaryotic-like serine/threonine-protein kinase
VPAWTGLARAAAMSGDAERSRKAYDTFLTLWKGADQDLPLLIEAKRDAAGAARP